VSGVLFSTSVRFFALAEIRVGTRFFGRKFNCATLLRSFCRAYYFVSMLTSLLL
jgi:hypothetical protein